MNTRNVLLFATVLLALFAALSKWTKPTQASAAEEQALIVTLMLPHSDDSERIYALEDKLTAAIKMASAGEFDGDEFGKGTCTLYMYGPDAERLYSATIKIIRGYRPAKGSYVIKRFGKPGAKQERIEF
jgi:hypothetical protein